MTFGNGVGGTRTNTLYFAAGNNGENDGLLGAISLANPPRRGGDRDGHRGNRDDDRDRGHASRGVEAADLVFALTHRSDRHHDRDE